MWTHLHTHVHTNMAYTNGELELDRRMKGGGFGRGPVGFGPCLQHGEWLREAGGSQRGQTPAAGGTQGGGMSWARQLQTPICMVLSLFHRNK